MLKTNKLINLHQLTIELGDIGLVASYEDDGSTIIGPAEGYEITDEALKAAVEAHIAIDEMAELKAKREAVIAALAAAAGLEVDEVKAVLG